MPTPSINSNNVIPGRNVKITNVIPGHRRGEGWVGLKIIECGEHRDREI